MKKWEYQYICASSAGVAEKKINKLGKDGWRVISIAVIPFPNPESAKVSALSYSILMEREILGEQPEQKEQILSPTAIALAEQRGN